MASSDFERPVGGTQQDERCVWIAQKQNVDQDKEFQMALMRVYASGSKVLQAKTIFHHLKQRGVPEADLYNALIPGFASALEVDEAMNLLSDGINRHLELNEEAFCSLLVACGSKRELGKGNRVHKIAIKHNVHQSAQYKSSRLRMLSGCRDMGRAEMVLQELKQSEQVTAKNFGVVIKGHLFVEILSVF